VKLLAAGASNYIDHATRRVSELRFIARVDYLEFGYRIQIELSRRTTVTSFELFKPSIRYPVLLPRSPRMDTASSLPESA